MSKWVYLRGLMAGVLLICQVSLLKPEFRQQVLIRMVQAAEITSCELRHDKQSCICFMMVPVIVCHICTSILSSQSVSKHHLGANHCLQMCIRVERKHGYPCGIVQKPPGCMNNHSVLWGLALQAAALGLLEDVRQAKEAIQERQAQARDAICSAQAAACKADVVKAAEVAAGLGLEAEIETARAAIEAQHNQLELQLTEASRLGTLQEFQAALRVRSWSFHLWWRW
jgi:hypothetical protein